MRKKAASVCMALGLLCLLASAALLGYNRWEDYRAGRTAAEVVSAMESMTNNDADVSMDMELADTGMGSADGVDSEEGEMTTVEIDGIAYIGTLTIPALNLELPIQSQWSYAGLKTAPGRYSGSAWMDDLVICGHNYTRHFGNLKYLEQGDEVKFTDVNGTVFSYLVEEVLILQPTDVDEMLSHEFGEWDFTLFTCTVGGQTRVTVRCSRTE